MTKEQPCREEIGGVKENWQRCVWLDNHDKIIEQLAKTCTEQQIAAAVLESKVSGQEQANEKFLKQLDRKLDAQSTMLEKMNTRHLGIAGAVILFLLAQLMPYLTSGVP
jgi:uncharacterized protein YpiB (UPF0302 family)